jgi:hypothetical protein
MNGEQVPSARSERDTLLPNLGSHLSVLGEQNNTVRMMGVLDEMRRNSTVRREVQRCLPTRRDRCDSRDAFCVLEIRKVHKD